MLREAKEEHAKESVEKKTQEVLEKVNFNDEFDRYQGLAHLEALEILSRECEAKVRPENILNSVFQCTHLKMERVLERVLKKSECTFYTS